MGKSFHRYKYTQWILMMQHRRCGSHRIAVKYFVLVNEKPLKNVRDNKKLMVTSVEISVGKNAGWQINWSKFRSIYFSWLNRIALLHFTRSFLLMPRSLFRFGSLISHLLVYYFAFLPFGINLKCNTLMQYRRCTFLFHDIQVLCAMRPHFI